MRLEYFHIKGFRRIKDSKILCGDATFLIGENNIGKSSCLKALEIFFSETSKLEDQDFFMVAEPIFHADEVYMEAKFCGLPNDSHSWRGFKGRIIVEPCESGNTNCIYYRKIFKRGGAVIREMKSCAKTLKDEYTSAKTIQDLLDNGISQEVIAEVFGTAKTDKTLSAKERERLELISEIWEVDESANDWQSNPGGIEGNISIHLPRFLLIPAESKKEEISSPTGILQKTMKELFEEIRDSSDNYKEAQKYLNQLAAELDPNDTSKEFGKMLSDVNQIVSGIFTSTKIHVGTSLSDPQTAIKPSFEIEMSSNVRTSPDRQGMGSLRSTVFALLHYREKFVERKNAEGETVRPLLIGFEEPEMYLHPNAASLMREKIYELATATYSKIICTTHSPYMIDLSKKIENEDAPSQILNLFRLEFSSDHQVECCNVIPFNTSLAYKELQEDEKQNVKFLLKIDDYVAKVFFSRKVIIVEGDTEELLIKETVDRLEILDRKRFLSNYQVVKARGKATMISLIKYLKLLGITPFVIHDKDTEEGAIKFNTPILQALDNNADLVLVVENTIEDILGYPEPTSEKPYKAYAHISRNWGTTWSGVPEKWRTLWEKRVYQKD